MSTNHAADPIDLVSFTDHGSREKSSDLARNLGEVASRLMEGGRLWEVAAPGQESILLAATSIGASALVVHALRVRNDRERITLARQMLHRFREEAVAKGLTSVEFIEVAPEYMEAALVAEGYMPSDDRWFAACTHEVLGAGDTLPEQLGRAQAVSDLAIEDVSQLERTLWPLKIVTGRVPTFIVPIKPAWARALFGEEPTQPELLPRPSRLCIAREHVYYRSYTGQFETPARILWWVSGGGVNGGMRAFSWLEEAVSARPRSLYRRFGGQGIYTEADVEALVTHKGGKALALVFSRTEAFRHHVPLDVAKRVFPPMAQNGYLQTSRRVSEHVFADFHEIGARLGD